MPSPSFEYYVNQVDRLEKRLKRNRDAIKEYKENLSKGPHTYNREFWDGYIAALCWVDILLNEDTTKKLEVSAGETK